MRLQINRSRTETEQTCEDCGERGTPRAVRHERWAQALDRMRNE
jgi:hypothetical protein